MHSSQPESLKHLGLRLSLSKYEAAKSLDLDFDLAEEAVSKLALGGPSALDFLLRLFPGASPQAGMDRAFGALRS